MFIISLYLDQASVRFMPQQHKCKCKHHTEVEYSSEKEWEGIKTCTATKELFQK